MRPNSLRIIITYLALLSLCGGCTVPQKGPDQEEWVPLFNGTDFRGWDIKIAGHALNDNYKNTFRVEDSIIKVAYDQYQIFENKYGHIYYQEPFSHYKLRVEYRFTGEQTPGGAAWNVRNSGVMIHSQSARSMGLEQEFPVSLEVQLLGGLGTGERPTGNLCTPGTIVEVNGQLIPAHCIDSNSRTYDGDQWVAMEAIVLGDSVVRHLIEGDTVLTYQRPQIGGGYVSKDYDWAGGKVKDPEEWIKKEGTLLQEGYIALQAESHPIEFRKVELLNLKGCMNPKCGQYRSYYVAAGACACDEGR
jgi:hypothetical protein